MKGITFNGVHSYNDLNLILTDFTIPPARPKTNYIDIPYRDGSIDLTEAMGEVKFENREATFAFAVFPYDDFEEKKHTISKKLNGQKVKIELENDPDYYWTGRCYVDSYASERNVHRIVIGATIDPYKEKKEITVKRYDATAEEITYVIKNSRRSVVPVITCVGNVRVRFEGTWYDIPDGTHKVLDIRLKDGNNEITVTGTGSIELCYREGEL